MDLIWQTANYLFTLHLLAFLSNYHRKQSGATRARVGVAGHLSTPLRWGYPVKCLSQRTTSEMDGLLNTIPLMLNF